MIPALLRNWQHIAALMVLAFPPVLAAFFIIQAALGRGKHHG